MRSQSLRVNAFTACAGLACLITSAGANADALHVTAASASSNKAYDLSFAPPGAPGTATGATQLPISPLAASPTASVRSIVYAPNEQTSQTDLIAADINGSQIVRYAPPPAGSPANTAWTKYPVWAKPAPGPLNPEGLSVDSFGNLYVNRGDAGHPEVWVLAHNPVQQDGVGGAFLPPVKMDGTTFGTGKSTRLLETLVVRVATPGGPGVGDLLVLVNDGRVVRYSAASIKSFLAGLGLTETPQTLVKTTQCPSGHTPTGMAIWPADGSLLVATVGGAVLRYTLSVTAPYSTQVNSFATGLGASLGKIKTFVSGINPATNLPVPYAVFDQPLRNKILEFGAPPAGGCPNLKVPCNSTPLGTITTTVSNPVGMAATDASVPSTACVVTDSNPSGCSLLGGALKVGVSSSVATPLGATVVAVSCTVEDPRVDPTTGNCIEGRNGVHSPLRASDVCPGYPNTTVPSWTCGASGATGRSMTFFKFEEQNGYLTAPADLLVSVELSADASVGGSHPSCPQLADGWAPLTGESTTPTPVIGDQLEELDSHCGSAVGKKPGHSLMLAGVQMVGANFPGGLVGIADQKFDILSARIAAANMDSGAQSTLASCVAKAQGYLKASYLDDPHRYACSAEKAWKCNSTVVASQFVANPDKLSAYSAIQGGLENLVMHINNRIAHPDQQPTAWPQPEPSPGLDLTTCDPPDTSTPDAPAVTVVSNATTQTSVTLTWPESIDNPNPGGTGIKGYVVTRTGPGSAVSIPFSGTCGTNNPCSVTDDNFGAGLNVETTYSYQVVALDNSTHGPNNGPNYSTPTSITAATLPDTLPPGTPTVTLGTVTTTTVALSWTASTDPTPGTGVGGYNVYRNNVLIQTVTGTSYVDNGLTPATPYSYQVAAFDKSTSYNNGPNVSGRSTAVPATTLTPPDTQAPTTPTGLHYSYTGPTALTMSWTASTDPGDYATGIGGYNVYLAGVLQGSTAGTSFPITLVTTTSAAQFLVEVEAFDKATPTPKVSPRASVTVTCYDPDTDHDCDALNHHH